jgi:hypothetical protein
MTGGGTWRAETRLHDCRMSHKLNYNKIRAVKSDVQSLDACTRYDDGVFAADVTPSFFFFLRF